MSTQPSLSYEHTMQLQLYFSTKLNVHYGIVTNGIEYRLYSDIDNPNVIDDEPFLTVDIRNLDDGLARELASFSKSGFDFHKALAKARELKYAAKIRDRIESEIEKPSRELIKYFARDLYSGSFTNAVADEFRPIIRQAFQDILSKDMGASPSATSTHKPQSLTVEPPPIRDKLQPFVPPPPLQTGRNIVEIPVFATYKGTQLSSTLLIVKDKVAHSKIRFNGSDYSVSKGALVAIKTVNPELKNAPNGWSFWILRDPSGNKEREIGDLRNDVALVLRMQGNA